MRSMSCPLSPFLSPCLLPQPAAQFAKKVLEMAPTHPVHHLLVALLLQPVST